MKRLNDDEIEMNQSELIAISDKIEPVAEYLKKNIMI